MDQLNITELTPIRQTPVMFHFKNKMNARHIDIYLDMTQEQRVEIVAESSPFCPFFQQSLIIIFIRPAFI